MAECTVCGKELASDDMEDQIEYEGDTYSVCCPECQDQFEESPEQYT